MNQKKRLLKEVEKGCGARFEKEYFHQPARKTLIRLVKCGWKGRLGNAMLCLDCQEKTWIINSHKETNG